jgi:hypothetical protein
MDERSMWAIAPRFSTYDPLNPYRAMEWFFADP